MTKKAKCEDCGVTVSVEIEEYDDVWLLMDKAGTIHDSISPDCKPHFFARIFPEEKEK